MREKSEKIKLKLVEKAQQLQRNIKQTLSAAAEITSDYLSKHQNKSAFFLQNRSNGEGLEEITKLISFIADVKNALLLELENSVLLRQEVAQFYGELLPYCGEEWAASFLASTKLLLSTVERESARIQSLVSETFATFENTALQFDGEENKPDASRFLSAVNGLHCSLQLLH